MSQIANFETHPTRADLFLLNGTSHPREYEVSPRYNHIDHLYISKISNSFDFLVKDWKLENFIVNGETFIDLVSFRNKIAEVIYDNGSAGSNDITDKLQELIDETNTDREVVRTLCKDGSPTLLEYAEYDAENPTAEPIIKYFDKTNNVEVVNPDLTGYKDCSESGEKAISYPIEQFTETNTGMGFGYTMPLSNIPIGVINSVWVGTASMAQESQLNYTDDGTNLIVATNTQIETGKLIRISGE